MLFNYKTVVAIKDCYTTHDYNNNYYFNALHGCLEVIVISGDYEDLRIGSSAIIYCTAPTLSNSSTISWLSQDGSVVSSSGVLALQPVNYSINGSVFTCSVDSPQLMIAVNQSVTVTIQGKSQR